MKNLNIALVLILVSNSLLAQSFMPEFGQQWNKRGYVIKNDNSRMEGKVTAGMVGMNGLVWIVLKDTVTDVKTKFKIADMKEVGIDARTGTKAAALMSAVENTKSIKQMANTDYKSILNADYYIYRRVVDKKGKPRILQLINPGFENKMQVYIDPKAKETGGAKLTGGLTGGAEKSFYVTKSSSYGIYLKKSKYGKAISSVFDDCPSVLEFAGKNPKFSDLAKHVHYYDNNCE
ncbi:MAG: hypothetical protein ABJF11_12375 [Reichenbachiella sp.]|uniref:hypothetical protein n=1 Tax=Reichenbachiella sp. TaxID=2184521 RepID=UPI003263FF15